MGKKAGITQVDVIDAACRLADEHGLDNLTLARLATDLGIRSPSLYTYVDGIDGLRRAIKLQATGHLGQRMTEARNGLSGEAALVEMCIAYRHCAKEHPGMYQAIMTATPQPGDEEMLAAQLAAGAPVAAVLGEMGIEGAAVMQAFRLYRAALHGFITLELEAGFGWDLDVDASFRILVEVLLSGLRTTLSDEA